MRPRILVVNDQQAIVDSLAAVLGDRGYEVAGRLVDQVALDDVLRFQPQLILMDGLSPAAPQAIAFMQHVWLAPATAHIRFIVTTAGSPRLRAMHAVLQAKGISIVAKPYRVETLLARVRAEVARGTAD